MQISPGTQLVWSLSGSEAINLGMPKIEPDHLYCGLLKFAELSDETIANLLNDSSDAPSVSDERDDLHSELTDLPGTTTEIRHAMRKEADHGTHKMEGNLIHRSDVSKKIFEKAIALANTENEPVYPTHLLKVLMEDPTPAMQRVLKIQDGVAKWLQELDEQKPETAVKQYFWLQSLQDLAPKKGFTIKDICQPQLIVLEKTLTANNPSPLLLICEAGVDATALLWKTDVDNSNLAVCKADIGKILSSLSEMDDPTMTGSAIARMVGEAMQDETAWLYFDLTADSPVEAAVWEDLKSLAQKQNRLILAASEKMLQNQNKENIAAESIFHLIWLHNLAVDHPVSRV